MRTGSLKFTGELNVFEEHTGDGEIIVVHGRRHRYRSLTFPSRLCVSEKRPIPSNRKSQALQRPACAWGQNYVITVWKTEWNSMFESYIDDMRVHIRLPEGERITF